MERDPAAQVTVEIGREVCQRNGGKAVIRWLIGKLPHHHLGDAPEKVE